MKDPAQLLKEKLITKWEYRTYLAFEMNDLCRQYLKESFQGINLEEPPELSSGYGFAWHDGRRSWLRDIVNAINKVEYLLNRPEPEEVENE